MFSFLLCLSAFTCELFQKKEKNNTEEIKESFSYFCKKKR